MEADVVVVLAAATPASETVVVVVVVVVKEKKSSKKIIFRMTKERKMARLARHKRFHFSDELFCLTYPAHVSNIMNETSIEMQQRARLPYPYAHSYTQI